MLKRLFLKYKQIISYLFFGVTTTAVNWCIYTPLHDLLRLDMTLSNAVAWFGAVLYAFITNKLFVFESKSMEPKRLFPEFVKFFATRGFSGVFEILLPTALFAVGLNQPLLGIEGGIAKALVSVLVIVMNYVLSKFVVFRKQ